MTSADQTSWLGEDIEARVRRLNAEAIRDAKSFRTHIALSKAGHYTVSVHAIAPNGMKRLMFRNRYIGTLTEARRQAAEFIATTRLEPPPPRRRSR